MPPQYIPKPPMAVYLIRMAGTDYYKIGVSRNAKVRLACIQSSSPFAVVLLRSVEHENALGVEQAIHEALIDYRVRGEWFLCAYKIVSQVFDTCSASGVADLPQPPHADQTRRKAIKRNHWMQNLPEHAHQITPAMIADARDLADNYGLTQGHIAAQLGISRSTVHAILRRKGRFKE